MDDKIEQYSPDNGHKLTFYDFAEPRMGMSICRFKLSNLKTNELTEFNELWAIGTGLNSFSWSDNRGFLSLPILNPYNGKTVTESFFIYNIEEKLFASIHFSNCWILNATCHNEYVEVEYDEQIESDHKKYPTKDLTKPANLEFSFSELKWTDIEKLSQFKELNKDAYVHQLKPIDNGWRLFKGQFPANTEVLVWELNKFAEYGDKQSIEWLNNIKAKTNKIDYWVKASYYLGLKNRKY